MNKEKELPVSSLVDKQDLDLQKMCGTWYIMRTTLSMWKKRRNPRFIYALKGSESPAQMLDITRYGASAESETNIRGIDTQDAERPKVFHWRGTQWYSRLITSDWCVLEHDDQYQEWMIIYFSATPFTQAGIDICARSPQISGEKLEELVQRIARNDQIGGRFANRFFVAQHDAQM